MFLDRDGVVNHAVIRDGRPYPPASVSELTIAADAADASRRLHEAGLLLFVVTNQPDVARGTQTKEEVEAINDRIREEVSIDEFFVCYHDDSAQCECRKPLAGSLFDAASRYGLALASSFMIGDRWRDVEAGQRAGCKSYFIDYEYAERRPRPPYTAVRSLSEAVDDILERVSTKEEKP